MGGLHWALLAVHVLMVGQAASSTSSGRACLVRGSSPSDHPLRLPIAGENICHALAVHCGGGREGAICVKAALEGLLPRSAGYLSAIFAQMSVPREFFLLCSPVGFADRLSSGGGGEHVAALTAMLHRARNASQDFPGSPHAAQLLGEYQQAALWAKLGRQQGWNSRDKIAHFLDALDAIRPIEDGPLEFLHLYMIDRLAVALHEAAQEAAQQGGHAEEEALLRRGRAMLLHYAVLSELIHNART